MKKYLFTILLIAVVAVAGGITYFSVPKNETEVDFDVDAEDFSMVVNTEKQIKYTLSINPSKVFVQMIVDDETILTIEKKDNGAYFAEALEIGSTSVTILAKCGKTEVTKIITISVVGDESEIVEPAQPPQSFEGATENLTNCIISENTLRLSVGIQGRFSISLSGINLDDVYIENTNVELIFENIDIVSVYTYGVTASQGGEYNIRCILNNSIVYNVFLSLSLTSMQLLYKHFPD